MYDSIPVYFCLPTPRGLVPREKYFDSDVLAVPDASPHFTIAPLANTLC